MSFIEVKQINKTFKVPLRSSGKFGTLKSFFSRKYNYINAIKDISFSIKKGEIVGYIGPNGAGKSTTIKCILNFLNNLKALRLLLDAGVEIYSLKGLHATRCFEIYNEADELLIVADSSWALFDLERQRVRELVKDEEFFYAEKVKLGVLPEYKYLKNNAKGEKYAHLIDKFDKYPLIIDKDEQVLSMPPIINGELTVIGRHLKKFGYNWGNAIIGTTLFSADEFADMMKISNATYQLKNSEGYFDFKYFSDGRKVNQNVRTRSVAMAGEALGNILWVNDIIQLGLIGYKTAQSLYNGNVIESAININDLFMNGVGLASLPGAIISLYWSMGGKELQQLYTEKIIMEQLKSGINPGLSTLQPYK